MPSAQLDNDSKYDNLVNLYLALERQKYSGEANPKHAECQKFESVSEALEWLRGDKEPSINNQIAAKTNVLITGSLYLVGLALKLLEYKID